ncbi:hypothetical protein OROGR_007962 [Orobanche gracilis]
MDLSKKTTEENRCRELAMTSSFCRRIHSEVEEVGWEHLIKMGEDLTFLSFRVIDDKGKHHVLEITLEKTYPKCPPSVSAHVNKLHDFWSALDDIDRSLWVTDPIHSNHATSYRQIKLGSDCCLVLSINVNDPLSLPECRFLGSDTTVNSLRKNWRRNCKRWTKDKSFSENLEHVLDTQLLEPPHLQKNEEQVECGICYAQFLPTDDELGSKSGSATDYRCENGSCSREFHSVCLVDWLRSITTTRQSFDVLFGNCPYCSDPVAIKISTI